jgi:predicted dehydrogenase
MTLRWGIVGTGRISASTVGDLHLTENVDLVAVASRTPAFVKAFAGVGPYHPNAAGMLAVAELLVGQLRH